VAITEEARSKTADGEAIQAAASTAGRVLDDAVLTLVLAAEADAMSKITQLQPVPASEHVTIDIKEPHQDRVIV
jgi:hypothetical protein